MAKWSATMMMMMHDGVHQYSDDDGVNDGCDDGVNVNKNEVT